MDKKGWFFVVITAIAVIITFSFARFPQNPAFNIFADQRTFFGIPHFFDVISNLPFLILGIMGLSLPQCRGYYRIFFWSMVVVSFGSAYYHLSPDNLRLFWDRFPVIVALMSLLAIVLSDRVPPGLIRWVGPVLIITGLGTTFYWIMTEMNGMGDLRPYLLSEYYPVGMIPLLCLFYPRKDDRYFYAAILLYFIATVFEDADLKIFDLTHQIISGHTLKHLLAACGVYCIYLKLARSVKKY